MGLDIVAYKNLKKVENPILNEDGYPENWETEWLPGASMKWSETHFKGRGEGIDPDIVYTYEDIIDFRAGSYSGYGWWRNQLEKFNKDKFFKLINFADNEGVIGPIVSKELYKNFVKYEDAAKEFSKGITDGAYWFEKYKEWKKVFEYAAENGAVEFF